MRAWTLALGLCAAGPIIAATARSLADGWLPAGDQANIATRAYDVFSSHAPLVGLHSDTTAAINHDVYSLGPLLFWLLSVPARLGSPGWMTATMALVNVAAVVGAVVLARRRGGAPLMVLTAVALAVMQRSLAPEALHDIWNPSAGLFPFTLLIFLCWSLACGEHRLLPLTVLVASFVVQCQLAFAPPSAAIVAIAIVGLAVALVRGRSRRAERGRVWPWIAAAVVVLAACWTAPVVQQLEGTPGNLTRVRETATVGIPRLGTGVGERAVVHTIGIPPWWVRRPASPWQRKYEVREHVAPLAVTSTIAILALLAGAAAVGFVRRRAELWSGALIALALCGGVFAVAAATPTKRVLAETLGYTMWWASPAGMFAWVVLVWLLVRLLGAALRSPRVRRAGRLSRGRAVRPALVVAGTAAALAAGAAVALAEGRDYHRGEYRSIQAISAGLDRNVPAGATVKLLGLLGEGTFRLKMAARFALRTHGVRPLSPGRDVRLGSWYDLDHRRYRCTIYVEEGARRPDPRAAIVARSTYGDGSGGQTVSAWVSPRTCPLRSPRPRR